MIRQSVCWCYPPPPIPQFPVLVASAAPNARLSAWAWKAPHVRYRTKLVTNDQSYISLAYESIQSKYPVNRKTVFYPPVSSQDHQRSGPSNCVFRHAFNPYACVQSFCLPAESRVIIGSPSHVSVASSLHVCGLGDRQLSNAHSDL